jgi:hypothetical protein
LAELWLMLKKEGRSGQTLVSTVYWKRLSVSEIARADREEPCLYRKAGRPQRWSSKIRRFSAVSLQIPDRPEEFFKVERTSRKLVHVRQTEAGH